MTSNTANVTITVPAGSNGRKGWAKLVTAVDGTVATTAAFSGKSLSAGPAVLPIGSVIVTAHPRGTAKRPETGLQAHRVTADGLVSLPHATNPEWPLEVDAASAEFFGFRDTVAGLLAPAAPAPSAALAAALAALAGLTPAELKMVAEKAAKLAG